MIIPATSTGTRVAWTAKASSASILDRPLKSTGRSARGDVFADVPIFRLGKNAPAEHTITLDLDTAPVMVVRHPCQCCHGDKLRTYRTVAPVRKVTDFDNFGPDRSGTKDKFALLGRLLPDGERG